MYCDYVKNTKFTGAIPEAFSESSIQPQFHAMLLLTPNPIFAQIE